MPEDITLLDVGPVILVYLVCSLVCLVFFFDLAKYKYETHKLKKLKGEKNV